MNIIRYIRLLFWKAKQRRAWRKWLKSGDRVKAIECQIYGEGK